MKKIYIKVKNQFDDLHCYPNAPEQVNYLRNLHRHTFMLTSTIQVFHEDRELEFYMVKDFIDTIIHSLKTIQISKSCENIASFVLTELKNKYGNNRYYKVTCSEDGWNEAIIEDIEEDFVK